MKKLRALFSLVFVVIAAMLTACAKETTIYLTVKSDDGKMPIWGIIAIILGVIVILAIPVLLSNAKKKKKAAEEAELKRKVECEDLIQEAIRLKNNGEYNSAKKKLDKARKMKIAEKEEAISTLEKEVLKLKSENSFWGNISKRVTKTIETILDDDKE